mmetsp:Transcript_6641/g.9820  ORF Transcript_6641/g.9820 Transcript_6641/m.9820 type:complete len:176 (-) Transcript_6641:315-842(-)
MYGGHVGGEPSLLNCRLADDDHVFSGANFDLNDIELSLPQSPYYYGYEYTVSKYREHQRTQSTEDDSEEDDSDDDHWEFRRFRELMWLNAERDPDLAQFFEQTFEIDGMESTSADDRKEFYLHCGPQCEFNLTVRLNFASTVRRFVTNSIESPHLSNGVTLRHILHEMFERPECL